MTKSVSNYERGLLQKMASHGGADVDSWHINGAGDLTPFYYAMIHLSALGLVRDRWREASTAGLAPQRLWSLTQAGHRVVAKPVRVWRRALRRGA